MFLLNILCSLFYVGKCLLISLMNILPTFVYMLFYGGLNHMLFVFMLHFPFGGNILRFENFEMFFFGFR